MFGYPYDKVMFPCAYPEYDEQRESTTFFQDFRIADRFGISAINDTFNRAFREWKNSPKYLTELVAVLNHLLWFHYNNGNEPIARIYDGLWKKAQAYGYNNLEGDDLTFFTMVLD